MVPAKRYFSVSSANDTLVLVKRIVADVLRYSVRLSEILEFLEAAEKARETDRVLQLGIFFSAAAGRLRACLGELDEIGVVMIDSAKGIVEFPCIADGTEVRLCWRHGEQRVSGWYEVGDSYALLRPIESLPAELEPVTV